MLTVHTDPGKFWNLKGTFSPAWKVLESGIHPGKSWNRACVLKSPGIGPTSWKVLESGQRPGKSWILAYVLESTGVGLASLKVLESGLRPGKSWKSR